MKRLAYVFLFVFLFCAFTHAQRRERVAVLEIKIHPDVERMVSHREAMEITEEIRRAALRVLPSNQYEILTSDAMQAVLGAEGAAECAERDCQFEIGEAVNAKYIVVATLSRFERELTLNVTMLGVDRKNQVESAEAVRSARLRDILEQSAAASADMFRSFLGVEILTAPTALAQPAQTPPFRLPPRVQFSMRYGGAALAVGGVFGGVVYSGMADKEYNRYKTADNTADADARRKDIESHTSTRDLFYILGGVGLSAFTLTLLF